MKPISLHHGLPFEVFYKDESTTFCRSKVEKDPQELIDEVYKILYYLGFTIREKAELATYQLKDVAQIWKVE